jgi:hypothetical protein
MRSVIKLADQTGVRNAVNVLDGGVAIGYGTSDVRSRCEARRDVGALNRRDVSGGWDVAPSRYRVAGQWRAAVSASRTLAG